MRCVRALLACVRSRERALLGGASRPAGAWSTVPDTDTTVAGASLNKNNHTVAVAAARTADAAASCRPASVGHAHRRPY